MLSSGSAFCSSESEAHWARRAACARISSAYCGYRRVHSDTCSAVGLSQVWWNANNTSSRSRFLFCSIIGGSYLNLEESFDLSDPLSRGFSADSELFRDRRRADAGSEGASIHVQSECRAFSDQKFYSVVVEP